MICSATRMRPAGSRVVARRSWPLPWGARLGTHLGQSCLPQQDARRTAANHGALGNARIRILAAHAAPG
eukprot:scaffold215_cov137-Isochrysis_galbana.AAC.1